MIFTMPVNWHLNWFKIPIFSAMGLENGWWISHELLRWPCRPQCLDDVEGLGDVPCADESWVISDDYVIDETINDSMNDKRW